MMRALSVFLMAITPALAFAAGSGSSSAPKPTETTTKCDGGQIYDGATKSCVDASQSSLDDDDRFLAVRELAYAGAFSRASQVLDTFESPVDDRALTYRGFIARKSGDFDSAQAYYTAAIARNPDNLLARSYMGQGLAETGNLDAARAQLSEIRARGGRNTWAEFALRSAIRSGRGYAY